MKLKHKAVLLKLSHLNSNWHLMPSTEQHLAGVPSEGSQWGQTFSLKRSSVSLKLNSSVPLWLTQTPLSAGGVCAVHAISTLWFDVDCLLLTLRLSRVLLLRTATVLTSLSPHSTYLHCIECITPFHRLLLFSVAFSTAMSQDWLQC